MTFAFTAGQVITQFWGGVETQSGANVTLKNAPYNGVLAPGATVSVGFLATWGSLNPSPPVYCLFS